MSSLVWTPGPCELVISLEGVPSLRWIGLPGQPRVDADRAALPLVEIRLAGDGGATESSERLIGAQTSRRLRYASHREERSGGVSTLTIEMADPRTGLRVRSRLAVRDGIPAVRAVTGIDNDGADATRIHLVSSLVIGGATAGSAEWWRDCTVSFAQNSWFREAVWQQRTPSELGIDDVGLAQWGYPGSRGSFTVTGRGSWSSGGYLPMGMLASRDGTRALAWQIEHNGPWQWEIADLQGDLYVYAGGPSDQAHGWSIVLEPGESFESVPVSIALGTSEGEALAALNDHRRAGRRPHPDNERLPIIFNDYMNCLSGDPTSEKLAPLVDAAASAGAEYFCIDAGWHAENGDWWSDVGEWIPSTWRFTNGLVAELDRIRERGMIPGLWIEPEVVGVNSPVAGSLPREAFFQRGGERVIEAGRYQLDFRHSATRAHLDEVIDRFVNEYGVGYLKFDYNIDVTQGTDVAAASPGAGQLDHSRAYLRWLEDVMDRHPDLVIENCSSGGQRMDYALLSLHPIQSTSDNQDPLLYAPIAAAAPTAVTPEQSASWAYPQPEWSDERNAFTLVNSLLGRVHLSGRIDLLDEEQAALVREAMAAYAAHRDGLRIARPFWPRGLPGWHDDIVALGLECDDAIYLSVWRRGGERNPEISLPALAGVDVEAVPVFPTALPTRLAWRAADGVLEVGLPEEPAARLIRLRRIA